MVLAQPDVAPTADRRGAARRQPALGTICYLASSAGDNLGTGLVWNISPSGLSLLVHRRLEPGTTVRADLMAARFGMADYDPVELAEVFTLLRGLRVAAGDFRPEPGAAAVSAPGTSPSEPRRRR